ncbi:MlaD family protein [Flavihumibacter fluvii]|uniref:MlaD family protein n=1 Tax=Flavihumibacter fluvii TaxID=2838157 RepID=UPI001BDEF8C9|nr:MlaD family protein [Flavihumibacter fluvii]ULQ50900.1 MlaD family protein [Flavihumibacter fluvii]
MTALKSNRPVVVGIFILIGIAILVVTIFTLGGQKKTFVHSFTIHAVFDDVGGLIKGNNVWFSGVKVGTVKDMQFYGNSRVDVTMSIEETMHSHIRKNAKARIGSDGLIGNRIVIIYDGDSTVSPVFKDDMLRVEKALSTDDMMATLQSNNQNLLQITRDFKSISKKIDSGKGLLSSLLNDPAMANKLHNTIDDLQSTVSNFKTVSVHGKAVATDLQHISGNLNKPGNSVNDMVNDTVMYNNIKRTLSQLEQSADAVSKFTINLKTVSERLNQDDNVVGVLLNDSMSAASMKVTLKNLESGSQKLDEDLRALQDNFLLRGYFKKKEKAKQ